MILIDATFVNSKGGINVFRRIIDSIDTVHRSKFILFVDKRLIGKYSFFHEFEYYPSSGFFYRILLFQKIKNRVYTILSLGNVPLIFTNKSYQITYIMQLLLFKRDNINSKGKLTWFIKSFIINLLFYFSNSDAAVQTQTIKDLISKKFNLLDEKILLFPVFDELKKTDKTINCNKFFYPSSGEEYKNVDFLIDVFLEYTKVYEASTLYLTISKKYKMLYDKLNSLDSNNIINLEEIKHSEVLKMINDNVIIVHPSSVESFGLVLLESAYSGNLIIAPNKKYVHDVCKPSLTFKENDKDDLLEKLNLLQKKNFLGSKPKIQNKSEELINYLISKLD